MKVRIYQIVPELDVNHLMFRDLQTIISKANGKIPEAIYECVYEGELEAKQLSWRVHKTVPACILLGPGHRLYEAAEVTLRDLENEIIIENRNRKISSNRFLRGIVHIPAAHVLIADDKDCRHKLVAQGLGFALSRKPSDDVIQKYRLRCIPVDSIRQQIISVTNPLQPTPPEVERFLSLLDEELA